ncbi:hypothetical protein I553_9270 [Mycobacterium xenopi 4042]|uniref:Uncharacterized protein n=1 Tax=Mycobacterium xenopi 4042 TaxID=1299334 RepID=X8E7Q4_MYCXE|nr:hypothetical protein I553_9270 [Mycobacterium xenopi 4042]
MRRSLGRSRSRGLSHGMMVGQFDATDELALDVDVGVGVSSPAYGSPMSP